MLYQLHHLLICNLTIFNQHRLWRVIPGSIDGASVAILLYGLIILMLLAVPFFALRQSPRVGVKICQCL